MFREKKLKINQLYLDPNNPRLWNNVGDREFFTDEEIISKQDLIFTRMLNENDNEDGHSNSIKEMLIPSIERIGFIPVDKIVVRPIQGRDDKFMVIEGNRRVTAVKRILRNYEKTINIGRFDGGNDTLRRSVYDTLIELEVRLVETNGRSDEEIRILIDRVLGIRHHGSLLEWEPLPKAYDIYHKYMYCEPKMDMFHTNSARIIEVSDILSIDRSTVRKALQTYIAFRQLQDEKIPVKDKHYSLVESIVTNAKIRNNYIEADNSTNLLTDDGLDKLNNICQFSHRDEQGHKNILKDPKAAKNLAKLVEYKCSHRDPHVREAADFELNQLEDESCHDLDIRDSVDKVVTIENQRVWVEALENLLSRMERDLDFADYQASSNEQLTIEAIEGSLKKICRMMDVN